MKKSNASNYCAWILSIIGTHIIQTTINVYLSRFCVDVLQMNPQEIDSISKMMMWVSIICVFLYIAFGVIMNNTLLKAGKAKPWLMGVSIPTAAFACLLFFVPENISVNMQLIYISVFYVLFQTGLTIILIARSSLLVLMSDNLRTRSLLSWTNTFVIAVLPFTGTLIMTNGTPSGYRTSVIAIMGFCTFVLVISGVLVREQHSIEDNSREMKKLQAIGKMEQLKIVAANKYWVLITAISIIGIISNSLQAASYGSFVIHYMNNLQVFSYVPNIKSIVGVAVLLLIPFTLYWHDSLKMVITGRIILALSSIICIFTSPSRVILLYIGVALQKVSEGFTSVNAAVDARLVDYIEYKHGVRQVNLVNAVYLSMASISTLVSNLFIIKTDPYAQGTDPAVVAELGKTAYYMYLVIPCILAIIIAVLTLRFDLTEKKINSMREATIEKNELSNI